MNAIINCKICGKQLIGKQTLFCSISCKNKGHQSYNSQKKRGIARKKQLVEMGGGKCSRCGYKKNLSALTFHHLNSKEKNFKLDMRSLSNRKFPDVLNEYKKCNLLCHNCHSEIHNPDLNLDSMASSRLL
jgi:hypothetical protein